MKKIIRTLAALLVLFTVFSDFSACRRIRDLVKDVRASAAEDPAKLLYLFVGLDDAAENTDVLCAVGFDTSENALSFVQIPRDTYCDFGGSQNKINQYFAYQRLRGRGQKEALSDLKTLLEETLGVSFDGCFAVNGETFRDLVDAVGGVDVTLPNDLTVSVNNEETTLTAGQNHLNGNLAELFVRNRTGYAQGDLSRLDTQKIFWKALLERVRSGLSLSEALPAVRLLCTEGVTDISIADAVTLFTKYRCAISSASAKYLTLPGAPALSESGLSYYVIARYGAQNAVQKYMFADGEFDPAQRLCDGERQIFSDIYFDTGIGADILSAP